jgi:hypothetical protein
MKTPNHACVRSEPAGPARFSAIAAVVALVAASSCVPQTRYEEARSAALVEQQGHRQALAQLQHVQGQLALLDARLNEREQQLEQRDNRLSQTELDLTVASKEREHASDLVDQLRGELARTGDHLHAVADQKRELTEALDAAETRTERLAALERQTTRLVSATRDLTLLLGEPLSVGRIELSTRQGRLTLRAPAADLESAVQGSTAASTVLGSIARLARLDPALRFELVVTSNDPGAALRLQKYAERVTASGVAAERITVRVVPRAGETDATNETADYVDVEIVVPTD